MSGQGKTPKNLFIRDGSYWARLWIDGREYRRCLHTASEKAALRALAALKTELAEAAHAASAERFTFKQAVVQWAATFLRGLAPRTVTRYRESLAHLDRTFGDKTLDQITPRLIGSFIKMRADDGVTNRTIKNDLSALSGILRVALTSGWIETNPAKVIDRGVLRHTGPDRRPPTRAEVEVVLRYPRTPGKAALIDFLHRTGVRLNAARLLRWDDVNLAAGTATLRVDKRRGRVIRLTTPGGDARPLLAAMARHNRSPYVFWHGEGEAFSQASRGLHDLYKRVEAEEAEAGREFRRFRTHDLRHSFAIGWLNAGGDIYELSRHLGHTSVKTTEEFYLRWMDPAARDRYEARGRGWRPVLVHDADRHQTGTGDAGRTCANLDAPPESVEKSA